MDSGSTCLAEHLEALREDVPVWLVLDPAWQNQSRSIQLLESIEQHGPVAFIHDISPDMNARVRIDAEYVGVIRAVVKSLRQCGSRIRPAQRIN